MLGSITTYTQLWTYVKKGYPLAVYEDVVVNLKELLKTHPGGPQLPASCVGREIGRWIYGSFKALKQSHKHTGKALEMMKPLQVGRIADDLPMLLFGQSSDSIRDKQWILNTRDGLTDVLCTLKLISTEVTVHCVADKIEHYGKYCTMTSKTMGVSRNYVVVHGLQNDLLDVYTKYAKAIRGNQPFTETIQPIHAADSHTLMFAVKLKNEPFTQWLIDEANEDEEVFTVAGPFVSYST